ncbi:hypothetical protein LCGC14_0416610 [marine sediment metagenome]|uniref:Fibronectin type-III domain-containing protein n=1 Tax=marine sediment metagenome TaxID=412755 RepID=A0A0F9TA54_9ZZZZ
MATPTVTTQECTSTIAEASVGHGNLTSLGDSAVSQHGHCWDTSTDPTTSNSKTSKGVAPNLGQFKSLITGLTPSTLYYVRAYATNSSGTVYGSNVTITTTGTIGRRHVWTEGTAFHYFDQYGVERKFEGTTVTGYIPYWMLFR